MNIADIKDETLKTALRQILVYCNNHNHNCVICELNDWCDEVTDCSGICGSMWDSEEKGMED